MIKETRIYNREKAVSSINSAGKTGQIYVKKKKKEKKLEHFLTPYTEIK